MHKGVYGLKKIIIKQDMEKEFFWIRKHYYTDLLKLFVVRDIDDYEDYKLDLYFTLHFLNIVKETNKTPSLSYLQNDLLKCNKECLDENINLAIEWYNKRVDNLFKNTEKENCIRKIEINKFDRSGFVDFVVKYSMWLTKELCLTQNHEVSFGEVNRRINRLLHGMRFMSIKRRGQKRHMKMALLICFAGFAKKKTVI